MLEGAVAWSAGRTEGSSSWQWGVGGGRRVRGVQLRRRATYGIVDRTVEMWEGGGMYGYGGYGGHSVKVGREEGDSFDDAVEGSLPMDKFNPFDELQVSTVEQLLSDPRGAATDDGHVEDEVAARVGALTQRNTGRRAAQASASSERDESETPEKYAKETRKRAPNVAGRPRGR